MCGTRTDHVPWESATWARSSTFLTWPLSVPNSLEPCSRRDIKTTGIPPRFAILPGRARPPSTYATFDLEIDRTLPAPQSYVRLRHVSRTRYRLSQPERHGAQRRIEPVATASCCESCRIPPNWKPCRRPTIRRHTISIWGPSSARELLPATIGAAWV